MDQSVGQIDQFSMSPNVFLITSRFFDVFLKNGYTLGVKGTNKKRVLLNKRMMK